jgi:hypothetical protein
MKNLKNKLTTIFTNLILVTFTSVFLYFVYFYISEFTVLINQ